MDWRFQFLIEGLVVWSDRLVLYMWRILVPCGGVVLRTMRTMVLAFVWSDLRFCDDRAFG